MSLGTHDAGANDGAVTGRRRGDGSVDNSGSAGGGASHRLGGLGNRVLGLDRNAARGGSGNNGLVVVLLLILGSGRGGCSGGSGGGRWCRWSWRAAGRQKAWFIRLGSRVGSTAGNGALYDLSARDSTISSDGLDIPWEEHVHLRSRATRKSHTCRERSRALDASGTLHYDEVVWELTGSLAECILRLGGNTTLR